MTETKPSNVATPINCPVCGSARSAPLFTSRNGYPILRCGDCGLTFTDDRRAPPPAELYPHFDQSDSVGLKMVRSGLSLFLRHREAMIRSIKPTGRLLDFGCGNGAFAGWMSLSGYEVVGLEPFSLGQSVTKDRLTLMQAPLEAVEGELGEFDVITLWHVLEHLKQPDRLLARLAERLRPGGVILVSVPNFRSWQRDLFNGGWFHIDPPRHLIHFDPETLRATLLRAGLEQVGERRFLPEYGSSGLVQSALNSILPRKNFLYELAKDRGALKGVSRASYALHLAASVSLGSPMLAASLPMEALASAGNKQAVLTVWAEKRP
jgi:SAM-dependent methyltransferase